MYSTSGIANSSPIAIARLMSEEIESGGFDGWIWLTEMSKLIEVSRAYESIARMVDATGDLSSKSIDKLGHVN